jgi:uncharacterized protein
MTKHRRTPKRRPPTPRPGLVARLWAWLRRLLRPKVVGPVRVVLDTNIFVGAIMGPGSGSSRVVDLWEAGRLRAVVTKDTFHEARLVLRDHGGIRRRRDYREKAARLMERLEKKSAWVHADPLPYPVSEDPSDDKFLAAAAAGRADFIISNDGHLWRLRGYKGVKILPAKPFLERIGE